MFGIWFGVWIFQNASKFSFANAYLKGILPVKKDLAVRLNGISALCPLCGSDEETLDSCHLSVSVWNASDFQHLVYGPSNAMSFNEWLLDWITRLRTEKQKFFSFIALLWAI